MKRVGIIGGGASGMMAAVAASEAGAQVTILEKQDRIGKKILATGNGKCNLSNLAFVPGRDYHSQHPERLAAYFARFSVSDAVDFFESRGLVLTDKNGYLYPRSGQASTVLNLFLELLEKYQVKVVTECDILSIAAKKGGYEVASNLGNFCFDALILAAGSPAGTKEKDQLGGLSLAKKNGFSVSRMLPALTALRCKGDFWKSLAGVRCDGEITLYIKEKSGKPEVHRERGEIQLTDYGISGIPTFQLSRHASLGLSRGAVLEAHLDFFPDVDIKEWRGWCEARAKRGAGRSAGAFLEGMVNKKIAQVLLKEAGMKAADPVSFPISKPLWKALSLLRDFPVQVTGTNPVSSAQVCLGGVLLSEVDENLQSKAHKGLYAAGELLDVDGRCGGYNLQWAWTSGQIAGRAAAKAVLTKDAQVRQAGADKKTPRGDFS